MAFMGRGGFSSIGNKIGGKVVDKLNENDGQRFYRGAPWIRIYVYVPLDNTYVIMQMILTFIILITGAITFVVAYKSTIIDPIESVKKIFLNTHLILIILFLVLLIVINSSAKNENILIKRLTYFAVFSIITMIVFLGIRLNIDYTYNKDKFEQLYFEQNNAESLSKKDIVNIGINGVKLSTEKEYYVDECMKLYGIFKVKTYTLIALHLLFNILLIFQISRVYKMQRKKEQIKIDDEILYDEEQNVKY